MVRVFEGKGLQSYQGVRTPLKTGATGALLYFHIDFGDIFRSLSKIFREFSKHG